MPIVSLSYSNGSWQSVTAEYKKADWPTDYPEEEEVQITDWKGDPIPVYDKQGNFVKYRTETKKLKKNIKLNNENREKNEEAQRYNEPLAKKDAVNQKILQTASNTKGGDYLTQKASIQALTNDAKAAGLEPASLLENYNSFYKQEKIGSGWDANLGAVPPAGSFDANYYLEQNPDVKRNWDNAVAQGDLDITERYKSPVTFALANYTYTGKAAGKRGNKADELEASKSYVERKPTDLELSQIKDKQLGVNYETLKQNQVDSDLESAITETLGEETIRKTKQFGALTQNVLKDTINEMKKAKAKEQALAFLGNLDGFQEILNVNESLSNSLIGDTGIGGILAFQGNTGAKAKESLEKGLQGLTGVNTSTVYNWQQWFDTNLKQKYDQDLSLGLSDKEAQEKINVEAGFARQFIDQYLVPRFNQSKSISEFADYLDVKGEEQSVFQTQDVLNAAAEVGDLKARTYLDQIKQANDAYFNPEFYFNPVLRLQSDKAKTATGAAAQQEKYKTQAETVAKDWEEAKKQNAEQNGYWFQQAYKYGVDVNDKNAFAKLHFQVQGQAQGFDGAEDIWNPSKIQDYIYSTILPAIKNRTASMSLFGEFIKPEEFADNLLSSYNANPEDKSSWNDVLKSFGLNNFQGSYDELKTYIADTFKTNSAIEMQAQINELQKKGIKPTQKNLGAFYIERPTDTAGTDQGETELYKAFKSSGYGGTEEDFYKNVFPDTDKEEQKLLTQASSKNNKLSFINLTSKDPFESLANIQKVLGDESDIPGISTRGLFGSDDDKTSNAEDYFKLGSDDEENYKSKTGSSILSEFTSMLKGY